jgi:hypothetical protein
MRRIPYSALLLSALALLGAAVASALTLAWGGSFPAPGPSSGPNPLLAEARGWSAVTLGLVVPLGFIALKRARHGSLRGRLFWAGTMAYLSYSYLELAASPPFTPLYLLYIATFAAAIPAFVLACVSVDVERLPGLFNGREPRVLLALFALFVAVALSAAWLRGILARSFDAAFGWLNGLGTVGHVVQALDLGLQVPLALATGILLLRRKPSGYLFGAVWLVMAAGMSAALFAMVGASALVAREGLTAALPFGILLVLCLALAVSFFRAARARGLISSSGQLAEL